jgi:hypothetical protein
MKGYRWTTWAIILVFGLLVMGPSAVAGDAKLQVVPDKTPLTPALIKKAPLSFKGSGFAPNEMILVEMIPPKGLKIKALPEGDKVGLATGAANDKGAFDIKMHPVSTLNWIFQVDWTPNMKPDLKKMTPLPPGKYDVEASGMKSGTTAKAAFELLKPPSKKK